MFLRVQVQPGSGQCGGLCCPCPLPGHRARGGITLESELRGWGRKLRPARDLDGGAWDGPGNPAGRLLCPDLPVPGYLVFLCRVLLTFSLPRRLANQAVQPQSAHSGEAEVGGSPSTQGRHGHPAPPCPVPVHLGGRGGTGQVRGWPRDSGCVGFSFTFTLPALETRPPVFPSRPSEYLSIETQMSAGVRLRECAQAACAGS